MYFWSQAVIFFYWSTACTILSAGRMAKQDFLLGMNPSLFYKNKPNHWRSSC